MVTLTVRLNEDAYRELTRRAEAEARPPDELAGQLLAEHLAEDETFRTLKALYAEAAEEDRALATAGFTAYSVDLRSEDVT